MRQILSACRGTVKAESQVTTEVVRSVSHMASLECRVGMWTIAGGESREIGRGLVAGTWWLVASKVKTRMFNTLPLAEWKTVPDSPSCLLSEGRPGLGGLWPDGHYAKLSPILVIPPPTGGLDPDAGLCRKYRGLPYTPSPPPQIPLLWMSCAWVWYFATT